MITLENLLAQDDAAASMESIAQGFREQHNLPNIDQLGFCIPSVEEAATRLESANHSSDFLISAATLPRWEERGIKKSVKGRIGIGYHKKMQIELLEAGKGTTFYSHLMSKEESTRLHHLGFFVTELGDVTKRMVDVGNSLYVIGKSLVGPIEINFHYIDSFKALGFYLEFICCSIDSIPFIPKKSMFRAMANKQRNTVRIK